MATSTVRKTKARTAAAPARDHVHATKAIAGSAAKDHDHIQTDPVSHPAHYAEDGQFAFPAPECIMLTRLLDFNAGNAVKYIWRAGFKGCAAEDLRKALWYIDDAIKTDWRRNRRTAAVCVALTLVKMLKAARWNVFAQKKLTAIQFLCAGFPSHAKGLVEEMLEGVKE